MKNLLILVLGIGAYYYLTQTKAISLLTYVIQGVQLSFQGINPVLRVNIGIQNVSNSSFTINSFVGNISSGGQNLGNLSSFAVMQIPAASQVSYPVDIRLNLIGAASDIISLINQGSGNPIKITFNGFVNANNIVAPVTMDYTIKM